MQWNAIPILSPYGGFLPNGGYPPILSSILVGFSLTKTIIFFGGYPHDYGTSRVTCHQDQTAALASTLRKLFAPQLNQKRSHTTATGQPWEPMVLFQPYDCISINGKYLFHVLYMYMYYVNLYYRCLCNYREASQLRDLRIQIVYQVG